MSGVERKKRGDFISHRFAVAVISILLAGSGLGWILTEFMPSDFAFRRELYAERWGSTNARLVETFGLYDPFHSFWYRGILALFLVVLLLCILSRWKGLLLRSLRVTPPGGGDELDRGKPALTAYWSDVARGPHGSTDVLAELEERFGRKDAVDWERMQGLFRIMTRVLRRRGYHVRAREDRGSIYFAAVAGRWRFAGNLLFHIGIVVITIGGMLGSFWGSTEILYGKRGDELPVSGSGYSIQVKNFEIITTPHREVRDYVSSVSILDEGGDTVRTGQVEVNHPLPFGPYQIHQSSYYVGENEFSWARLEVAAGHGLSREVVTLRPDEDAVVDGMSLVIKAKRFLPDFRMDSRGAFSASATMNNPALEVEVVSGGRSQRGWLSLLYPRFNSRFELPVALSLLDVEPVYYTGLQVSTNPGSTVFLLGMVLSSVGVCLLYLFSFRSMKGCVDRERLRIVGSGCSWKASFADEFYAIGSRLKSELYHEMSCPKGVHEPDRGLGTDRERLRQ